MTHTDGMPPLASAASGRWEQCDHCQAPVDARQRYCVACGARRPHVDDPVARWFVATEQRARAGGASGGAGSHGAGAGGSGTGGAGAGGGGLGHGSGVAHGVRTALLLALLPLAAAAGVFVGRGSGDDSQLLVDALKAQKAPVVSVVGGAGAAAGTGSDAAADDDAAARAGRSKGARAAKTSDGNEVLSTSRYGDARQLTGARVTAKTREESKRALDKIVNSKGREYVDSQRGLPDQIVIP